MHNEKWQVFSQNGLPIKDEGHAGEDFTETSGLVQGNAHVWLWRVRDGIPEVLLQRRSKNKEHHPGWLHLSAGGHIDLGETVQQAAVREVKEELGLDIAVDDLYYVLSARGKGNRNDITNVFIVRYPDGQKIRIETHELDQVTWIPLDEFAVLVQDAARNNILDHRQGYFDMVIEAIRYKINEN